MRTRATYRSRIFERHDFDLRVKVLVQQHGQTDTVHGRTRDLSFSGIGVTLVRNLAQGTPCVLIIKFPKVDFEAHFPAIVIQGQGSRFGLQFQRLSGEQRLLIQKICKALPAA